MLLPSRSRIATVATGLTALLAYTHAQETESTTTTEEESGNDHVIWHNRYHAVLAMAAYGDWNTLCPTQTFTQAGLLANFPNSTDAPWTVLDTWGPTPHGAEGWTAFIPEMNKVTWIWKGDYNIEKNLPQETAPISSVFGLDNECGPDCRANAFALAGYIEAYQATNGFENAMRRWNEIKETTPDFYASTTGHGLGGMHSVLSTVHLGSQGVITFSHNYGAPRTLNPAAASYHNFILGGDQLDRGAGNADVFMSFIPQSSEYTHVNTGIRYFGWDDTYKMNTAFCYEDPENPACLPVGDLNEVDHYFYFSNVGQCGGAARQNRTVAEQFIAEQQARIGEMRIPSAEERATVLASRLGLPLGDSVTPPNPHSIAASSAASSTVASSTAVSSAASVASTAATTGASRAIGAAGNAANTSKVANDAARESSTSGNTGAASRKMGSVAGGITLASLVLALALF
ncbi:hypothetical protein P389DRAFT_175350 [Cystobasidium minutum MCA 4210]|uniref:uncharacterized protein n=1 Tax=Cystobasidium minutum MCA 4210 TaxID=1397322 RepID=UPI0034CE9262|eukprot:jgi/Rhomi1/175350/fgenesh1_kg.10_\